MWKLGVAALLCVLGSLANPAAAYRPGDEVCTLSEANQCAADTIKPSSLDGSVLIYPGGKTRCAFDDFTGPNGSFKSNKTYFFQVFPNQKQDPAKKKKVMLFFQGGGACTGADTCSFSLQCSLGKSSTFTATANAASTGVLNRTNPDNLFKDWDIVHIPYCTGDLHAGNAVRETTEGVFEVILDQSQCMGKNMKTYLNGYENTQSALKWAFANYPNPEHLIIGGASAGSLAAQALSVFVADMWKVQEAGIRYSVLADSYVGVLPEEEKPASTVLDYFGTCDVDLKAPADTVAACKVKTLTVPQLMTSLLKQEAFSDWLFIDSKADQTQRYFYQLVKDGLRGYPFTNLLTGDAFFKEVGTMINAYRSVSSRISTFFVEGEKHVFTMFEGYTNVTSDSGDKLGDYLTKWLLPHDNSTAAPATSVAPAATPSPTSAAVSMAHGATLAVTAALAVVLAASS